VNFAVGTSGVRLPRPDVVLEPAQQRSVDGVLVELALRFPPRLAGERQAAEPSREQVLTRLLAPPFVMGNPDTQRIRTRALGRVLDWLQGHPGQTWQERWNATGANLRHVRTGDWRPPAGLRTPVQSGSRPPALTPCWPVAWSC
jgi:hypothetical protein